MAEPVILNIDDFKLDFPQFTGLPDAVIERAFKHAVAIFGNPPAGFKGSTDRLELILYTLMCHLLTSYIQGQEGQSGPLTSATEGSVSASFYVPQSNIYQWLGTTPCGQKFLFLTANRAIGGLVSTPPFWDPWM